MNKTLNSTFFFKIPVFKKEYMKLSFRPEIFVILLLFQLGKWQCIISVYKNSR